MLSSIAELQEEFQDLETPEERIQYLIELGQSLPDLPSEFCTEQYRVVGCQSMVWFVPNWNGSSFDFQGSSDAPMVRGLVAVLLAAYSGKTPREIVDFPIEEVFERLHLRSFLSPLRSNGLNSMIKRIREYAGEKLTGDPVWTDPARRTARADFGPVLEKLDTIRADFPILQENHTSGVPVAYLDNAASSQRPSSVIETMSRLYSTHYSNVHRSGHEWGSRTTELVEASREAVRSFIHARSTDEVIFTPGTTASINLIAQTWGRSNLREGDEILLSEMEHHSNIVPWQQLCSERRCRIRWIPIREDFTLDLESLGNLLNDRTRLVACTAVSNVLGTINPIREIVSLAHRTKAIALVDAAQAVPHGPIDVQNWNADFVVFSGHKMLASTGVGICYGKRVLLESMHGWQGGGNMIKSVTWDGFTEAGLPHRFEAGTPPIAEIVSMKPAIDYLENIGGSRLMEYERQLVAHASEGLATVKGVRTFSPSIEKKSGILSFVVDGLHGEEVARFLDARGIAVRVGHHCAMPLHSKLGIPVSCRASFYFYNTLREVERFVEAVDDASRTLSH